MGEPPLAERAEDGLILPLRVTPRAGRRAVAGTAEDADGRRRPLVRATAAPEDGRADAAVVRLLAERLRLSTGAFGAVADPPARRKRLRVTGDPDDPAGRPAALVDGGKRRRPTRLRFRGPP